MDVLPHILQFLLTFPVLFIFHWLIQGSARDVRPLSVQFLLITARKRSLGQSNIFCTCLSFCSRGVPGPRVCLVPGGLLRGRGWSWEGGGSARGGVPGGDPSGTATAADGTHPTGMHSYFFMQFAEKYLPINGLVPPPFGVGTPLLNVRAIPDSAAVLSTV